MFDNIASRLQTLAKVICWLGIIGAVIYFIVFLVGGANFFLALLYGGLMALVSWIGSWATYALGVTLEKVEALEYNLAKMERTLSAIPSTAPVPPSGSTSPVATASRYTPVTAASVTPGNKKKCPHCGANNNKDNSTCFACGQPLE